MLDDAFLRAHLDSSLERTDFDRDTPSWRRLGSKYEGKVRDNYTREGRRFIVVTDRISAFDQILGTIPFKGQVLNRLAAWWFEETKGIAKNHVISVPDPNVLECVECTPLPVEMVVRAYITGSTSTSMWTHYAAGARTFAGHALREGLKKNEKLEAPVVTPATKAPLGQHDVTMSREEILARGELSAEDFDRAAQMALAVFREGQRRCLERGLILVDTKYEFGKTRDGEIVFIDEIHTPDSSRFWMSNTYEERFAAGLDPEPLDKDFVRRYYTSLGYRGDGPAPALPADVRVGAALRYAEAFERITGERFVPDTRSPQERIATNLGIHT